jgi:methylglutaconyl-CoA hydratase
MSDLLYSYELEQNGVATVTLNRPDIHNAFNDTLINQITELFLKMQADDSVNLVVLTGAGKSFCAGADINWMKSMVNYSEEENYQDSKRLAKLFQTINDFTKPVIGKINGAALGGGAGLVAVCDYVIAHEKALFGFTEARLGLVPAVISPFVLEKVPATHARHLFLTGKRFDAMKAQELGLVHQVCLSRHFQNDCKHLIEEFMKSGPVAMREAKALIKNVRALGEAPGQEGVTDLTCKTIARVRTSEEGQEGMAALLEKRAPRWMNEKDN